MSAESGLATFRDAGGLWEGHDVMQVATPAAWEAKPELVLEFYNQRRKQLREVKPNKGHQIIASWEAEFDVTVITQNVDNLHEKAGSTHVIHLHGELTKVRSTLDENLVYELEGWELKLGDFCEKGHQLRPHVVWFGEPVPAMGEAMQAAANAEIFVVVGTSLLVYPAAGLIDFVPDEAKKFVVDPQLPEVAQRNNLVMIEEIASTGLERVSGLICNG